MTGGLLVFSQTGGTGAGRLFGDLLPWLGLLVVIILIGGGVAIWLRRRLMSQDSAGSLGFTLGDLREMRARGEISDTEFEAAKSQMIAGLTRADRVSGSEAGEGSESGVPGRVPARRDARVPGSTDGDGHGRGGRSAETPRSAAEDGNG